MNRLKVAELARELAELCSESKIPINIQMDLTETNSEHPELFLAAVGDLSDYLAMTAEHLVSQAEEQVIETKAPLSAIIKAMLSALEVCAEVSSGSEIVSTDIDEIKERLTVRDKDTLN